jgi:AbrB family looped-hinge helix DNA binding protein
MKGSVTTVSTKGQLVIPAEMRNMLGIEAGTLVALTLEEGAITLRPVSNRLVDETCGMFAGGPSLADDLQEERRSAKW